MRFDVLPKGAGVDIAYFEVHGHRRSGVVVDVSSPDVCACAPGEQAGSGGIDELASLVLRDPRDIADRDCADLSFWDVYIGQSRMVKDLAAGLAQHVFQFDFEGFGIEGGHGAGCGAAVGDMTGAGTLGDQSCDQFLGNAGDELLAVWRMESGHGADAHGCEGTAEEGLLLKYEGAGASACRCDSSHGARGAATDNDDIEDGTGLGHASSRIVFLRR